MERAEAACSSLDRKPISNGVTNAVHIIASAVSTSHHMRNRECGEIVVRPMRSI